MSKGVKRLFKDFQPSHYRLEFVPDVNSMTFHGSVSIEGKKTGRPSQRLTFHQKDLKITSARITYHGKGAKESIEVSRINHHKGLNEIRLHAAQLLYPGAYTIVLDFSGKITPNMQGIYPCNFKHKGKEHVILATQFEAPHAREAFPCIDEPEAKATFSLTVTAPKNQVVLSNTLPKKITTKASTQTVEFEVTPKMSTYLLAFILGDMHSYETKTKSGVTVRSWGSIAQPNNHLHYSAEEGARILDFFADYFGIPYPLTKLDQVALPDFDAGAMENWGLVTYRETAMLTDPINRSISSEQFVSLVVAHELSHQWFGNLVTMKWWDDLWLNESFAGLMEHVAPSILHPDWQQWEIYAAGDISLITSRDVYKDIQPVGVEVTDPDLIESAFDPAIVYAKGARLIKMLREYIGDEAFIKGLKAYFTDHAYGNATRHDLWDALAKSSHKDIDAFMTPWLTQPGMPVLHVNQKSKILELSQERFLLDAKPDATLWPLPLLADKTTEPNIFSTASTTVSLDSADYILLNQYGSGQYLTHYTQPAHREHLAGLIASNSIPPEARINLLNDMYMLARHGDASLTDALDVIKQCSKEPRDSVWALMARVMGASSQLTEGDKTVEKQLNSFKVLLARDWYEKLGWSDEPQDDPNTKQLRHTMVALMTNGEDPEAIKHALRKYRQAKTITDIDAELRNTILVTAVRHGDKTVIPSLIAAYDNASPELQQDITAALTSTKKPAEAKKIIAAALGPNGFVRAQDILRWVAMLLRNHHVREVAWEFMESNWKWLEDVLGASKSFDYLPTYAASIITTEEWAKKYRDFFEPKEDIKVLQHNIKLGYADIGARVAWRKREETKLKAFFKNYS